MGRKDTYEEEDLEKLLLEIDQKYGDVTIEILRKAHKEDPSKYPACKTFERRFGGIKKIRYLPILTRE